MSEDLEKVLKGLEAGLLALEQLTERMAILEHIISCYAYHHTHAYDSDLNDKERAIVDEIENEAGLLEKRREKPGDYLCWPITIRTHIPKIIVD